MEKKVIILILSISMVGMLLLNSSNTKLRQKVENLESELSSEKEKISEIQSELSQEKEKTSEIQCILSDYYEEWNRIATCDYATEQELLLAAKQCTINSCSKHWATTIATSLCANPAVTGKVIQELLNSPYFAVWNIAANSVYADEEALLAIAKQCVSIQCNEPWVTSIAMNICKNPAATGKVIKELSNVTCYSVWNIAAQSVYADEEALIAIAKQCAEITDYAETDAKAIATSICENAAVTDNVLKELGNSEFASVHIIAFATFANAK